MEFDEYADVVGLQTVEEAAKMDDGETSLMTFKSPELRG
jgi:hypothetical protein